MNEPQDDPLFGLLTDIAEGVAALAARVDAIEARMAAQNDFTNEALATIAEIATRTYYASKPSSALPDEIINARVMDAMIERWPSDWRMAFAEPEYELLKGLEAISSSEIEAQLRARVAIAEDATNMQRLRHARMVTILTDVMSKRLKDHEKRLERDRQGRER